MRVLAREMERGLQPSQAALGTWHLALGTWHLALGNLSPAKFVKKLAQPKLAAQGK